MINKTILESRLLKFVIFYLTRFEYDTEWEVNAHLPLCQKVAKFLSYEDPRDILKVKQVAELKVGMFLGEKSFLFNTFRTSNIVCTEDS